MCREKNGLSIGMCRENNVASASSTMSRENKVASVSSRMSMAREINVASVSSKNVHGKGD